MQILISGASIAGPVLAYWLSRRGFDVTVVERAPALRKTGGHAVDLFQPAMQISEQMGVLARIQRYAAESPFVINSVVVGNVQYPEEVAMAVSRKLAATQELQRKDTEIEIERKERVKREVQAQGIANAMEIIRGQLSGMYIQHEAIEAQKLMVNSPNHTVVYIPVGNMGVPLTGTFNATEPRGAAK